MPIDEPWLAQIREDPLEPERPICDPHHHLWDRPESRYLLDELLADTGRGHRIVSTVFVECRSMYRADGPERLRPVGETEFVQGVAAMTASGTYGEIRACAGIVGFADLTLGRAVREVLEAHCAASPQRFRGIRHAAGWDASPDVRNSHTDPPQGLLREPRFREGVAVLGEMGLVFEAWLYHPQIAELTELARACPEVPIVLDHLGGPIGIGPYAGRGAEVFERWRRDLAELARCGNVTVKLGGLNMALNGYGWHKRERPPSSGELLEATRPWYEHAIECFGPERCMFESNFPVDKVSCGYDVLWNSFKRLAGGYSETENSALFHDTATRVYRLDRG